MDRNKTEPRHRAANRRARVATCIILRPGDRYYRHLKRTNRGATTINSIVISTSLARCTRRNIKRLHPAEHDTIPRSVLTDVCRYHVSHNHLPTRKRSDTRSEKDTTRRQPRVDGYRDQAETLNIASHPTSCRKRSDTRSEKDTTRRQPRVDGYRDQAETLNIASHPTSCRKRSDTRSEKDTTRRQPRVDGYRDQC
ncbi:hypothetical protein J6590_056743 [Homalodisca vitripennis]|nr:hypothetical protein J6590_056743 [Homalodisca vitripennis]